MGDKIDWAQVDLPIYCAQVITKLLYKVSNFIILRRSSIRTQDSHVRFFRFLINLICN